MPSCQWELEPEVFAFTVRRVYAALIRSCPLIRSAHFQVMDDVCSPPFYYARPFNGAPRLKRCHISWQLPPHPLLDQLHRLLWVDQAQMRKCGKSDQVEHFRNRLTQRWSSPFHCINLCVLQHTGVSECCCLYRFCCAELANSDAYSIIDKDQRLQ